MMDLRQKEQRGSVVVYIMIAIFLMAMLMFSLSQGTRTSLSAQQVNDLVMGVQADIQTIHAGVLECAQTHPDPVDVNNDNVINSTDNPNSPFPIYYDNGLTSGVGGTTLDKVICLPQPVAYQKIFYDGTTPNKQFRLLDNTNTYTTTYYNDGTEGVYLRITRTSADPVWSEAILRLNDKYSECSAAAVTDEDDCETGCLYYWILRRTDTTALGGENDCLPIN